MSESRLVLENATVLDVIAGKRLSGRRVIIQAGNILRVEAMNVSAPIESGTTILDIKGMTVMPGLCDAHVHVTAWTADLSALMRHSPYYTASRSVKILEGMLMRGFTTVRDVGGADYGLACAVEEGSIRGPRIVFGGQALSPTGGHGDMRSRGEEVLEVASILGGIGRICDGVAEVRHACRDEIRKGARHIKLMLNGGIASPTDRIGNLQFSRTEIQSAVEEARMAGLYCVAHTYTAEAVNRGIELGVRSLEHCNLIDESSIELFKKHDAFMVPTLVIYDALESEGVKAGLPAGLREKIQEVKDAGLKALELAHRNGVKLAYGTDLLGAMHRHQLKEFAIRSAVQPPLDIIRAATCNVAELLNEVGETGVVAEGARADLLVIDGDPLEDLACLQDPERCLKAIIQDGQIRKNELDVL